MSKQMLLNAFAMNCVAHQSSGLWRHPRDRSREYFSLEHWQDLARTLERGLFDGIFLADVTGTFNVAFWLCAALTASAVALTSFLRQPAGRS